MFIANNYLWRKKHKMPEPSAISRIRLEHFENVRRDMSIGDSVYICDDFVFPEGLPLPFKMTFTSAVICLKGELRAIINQKELRASRGDIIISQYGSIVEEVGSSEDFKSISMVFMDSDDGNLFNRPAEELGNWLIHRSIPVSIHLEDPDLGRYLKMYAMAKELYNEAAPTLKEDIVKGFISMSVASFLSTPQMRMDKSHDAKPESRSEEVFLRFKDDLQLYAARERSVQFYADRLCISPKHFSKLVRQASGKLPMEHIRSHVIIEAKTLLRSSGMSVREIADALNFPTDSFFCHYFKQSTGVSPTEYRNRLGN